MRKAARRDGYQYLHEFHSGLYECDHVSPWTRSGSNVDAAVMVIGQDWSSADVLAGEPNREVARDGFDGSFQTNRNLDDLLGRHFRLARTQCYLTNLFPFIKPGGASSPIPMADLVWSAREFTLPEVRAVAPKLAICLGLRTFHALARADGRRPPSTLAQAIASPFEFGGSRVHCVAHTGALGMNNRSRAQVDKDWEALAKLLQPEKERRPTPATPPRGSAPRRSRR